MDYQAVLRRKKDEEKKYRDINGLGNFDDGSSRGYQVGRNVGASYPLRRTRSAELQESSREGPTPYPFLTPSPHMLVPGAGQRGGRFLQDSGPGQYNPSFGQESQKRISRSEIDATVSGPTNMLPWEEASARIEMVAGGSTQQGAVASVQGSGLPPGPQAASTWGSPRGPDNSGHRNYNQKQYREELQRQMEEQRRLKWERKAREREEDEKVERRAEEQRQRMLRELEEEAALRKIREQKLQQKQEFLIKKQEEFAAGSRQVHKRQNKADDQDDNSGHRGWTPAPDTKVNKASGHRGWTPPPPPPPPPPDPAKVQRIEKEVGHRGWTPAPGHRGWTPPPKEHKAEVGNRGWTPPPAKQPQDMQLNNNHPVFTSTTGASRCPVPESRVPPKSWEVVDLEPSVLDEIAQLRQRLRSEQKRQDNQQQITKQRYYRILSHQFFDD